MNFLLQTVDKKIVHDFGFALTQSKDYINWVSDYYAMTIRKHEGLDFSGIKNPDKYIPVGSVDFVSGEKERINHIIDIINGECPTDYESKWTAGDDVTEIYYKGKFQFLVRGWGYLTGCGGLNLPEKLASEMQEGFINYILDRLNGK